jgi:hypothetical protein
VCACADVDLDLVGASLGGLLVREAGGLASSKNFRVFWPKTRPANVEY